jgi:pyroglutamyl-peptidase
MTILVTGFGPFLDVADNASGRIAASLDGTGVDGSRVVGRVLPTSFARARDDLKRFVAECEPKVVIALGVAREDALRLERRAGAVVTSAHPDVDGASWSDRRLGPRDLATPLPLQRWVEVLARGPGPLPVRVSEDCGGYVCNATYHAALEVAPAASLFVHLPRVAAEDEAIGAFVRASVLTLARLALGHLEADDLDWRGASPGALERKEPVEETA